MVFSAETLLASGIGVLYGAKTCWGALQTNEQRLKALTIDLTELARQGKICHPAYQRTEQVNKLAAAVLQQQKMWFLVGPSGAGKTEIVEGLAYSIVNGHFPALANTRILALNLKAFSGGGGLAGLIQNIWGNDKSKKIKDLFEVLKTINVVYNNPTALFIDEIQDLINNNFGLFDHFKEDLARRGVVLIGATTESALVSSIQNRSGSGAGMARRVEEISVLPMSEETTIAAFLEGIDNLSQEHRVHLTQDGVRAIVWISALFKRRVFPDKAAAFLKAICADIRLRTLPDSQDLPLIDEAVVIDYFVRCESQVQASLIFYLNKKKRKRSFAETFEQTYSEVYPAGQESLIPQSGQVRELYQQMKVALGSQGSCRIIFENPSKNLLKCIAINNFMGKSVYTISVEKLLQGCHAQGDACHLLKRLFQKIRAESAILILEDGQKLFDFLFPSRKVREPLNQAIQSIENNAAAVGSQLFDIVQQNLGVQVPSPQLRAEQAAQPFPEAPLVENSNQNNRLLDTLRKYIEEEEGITILAPTSSDASLSPLSLGAARNRSWSVVSSPELNPSETLHWLETTLDSPQPWLQNLIYLVFAFKKGSGALYNPVDVCTAIFAQLMGRNDIDNQELLEQIQEKTGGVLDLNQLFQGLVTRQMILQAASSSVDWGQADCLKSFFPALFRRYQELQPGKILFVQEPDREKAVFFRDLLIQNQSTRYQNSLHLDARDLDPFLPDLSRQEILLDLLSSNQRSGSLFFVQEDELENRFSQINLLQKRGWNIVCFSKEKQATGQAGGGIIQETAQNIVPQMANLVNRGTQLLQQAIGDGTRAIPLENRAALPTQSLSLSSALQYMSTPFTEEQFHAWFTWKTKTFDEEIALIWANCDQEIKRAFCAMCFSLWSRLEHPFPLRQIKEALIEALGKNPSIKADAISKMYNACKGRCPEREVSLKELQYAVEPSSAPLIYRIQRVAESSLAASGNAISATFSCLTAWISIPLRAIGGVFATTRVYMAIRWLFSR